MISRRSRHPARASIILLAHALLASPVAAQVAGTVHAAGAPLPRVVVALWNGSREVARDTTDAAGRFGFDVTTARDASGLALRRLGYVARTLAVRPGDDGLRLTMAPVAQPLPAAVVRAAKGRACARTDDVAARRRWNDVRATYAQAPAGLGHSADYSASSSRVVTAAEVGEVDESRPYRQGESTSLIAMSQYRASLARDGYASRLALPRPGEESIHPEYLHWWYAPLHRELVERFLDDAFVQAHALTFAVPAGEPRALAFCPRDRRRPGLEGTIELDSAGAIARIAWRWRTPKPDEDAGAELLLMPPTRAQARRLVPARSVYWRRAGGRRDRYYQDAVFVSAWYYPRGDATRTDADRVAP